MIWSCYRQKPALRSHPLQLLVLAGGVKAVEGGEMIVLGNPGLCCSYYRPAEKGNSIFLNLHLSKQNARQAIYILC